jgi:hypothetical protein
VHAQKRIVETKNRLRFLTASFSRGINRSSAGFESLRMDSIAVGIPSHLSQTICLALPVPIT